MFNPVRVANVTVLLAALASPAAAQSEGALKSYFEGTRVTLRLDMPGASDGVDVHPDAGRAIDYKEYGNDLKRYGTAIRSGDTVSVTLVKLKKDLIEFQLAGGGFGTFSDDTSTSASIPFVQKSDREKNLEKRVHDEDDRERKRELQRDLEELRDRRERENRRITAERERIEERKKARIAEERLRGGSRFNLRYKGSVPPGIRPEDVIAALSEYVDFHGTDIRHDETPAAAPGDITQLRKGMLRADAEREFGTPVQSSERREGEITIVTLVFGVGEQRVAADFVEDVMVRYTITSR
jgi:hypothetical protein